MACNSCETFLQSVHSVIVSIQKSGSTANLYVQNQGRNAILIRRILICTHTATGTSTLYLRAAPQPITWVYQHTYLEQDTKALFYQLNNVPAGAIVQAQAEYIEIDGRSRSCAETM